MREIKFRTNEQYIGLKDKNGKEIYEGDILEIEDRRFGRHKDTYKASVVYESRYAMFTLGTGGYTFEDVELSKIEVIGNIHENPELLEK